MIIVDFLELRHSDRLILSKGPPPLARKVFRGYAERMEPETPENPALLGALYVVARDDGEPNRRRVYQELLGSLLLVPVLEPPRLFQNPWRVAPARNDALRFSLWDGPGSIPSLPVFSDIAALRSWRPGGCPFVVLGGTALFQLSLKRGWKAVLLNPSGPAGGEIPRSEFQALAEGRVPDVETCVETNMPAGTTYAVLPYPGEVPADAVESVREALTLRFEIHAAYLFVMALDKEEQSTLGLCLEGETDAAAFTREVEGILAGLRPVLDALGVVNIVRVEGTLRRALDSLGPPLFARRAGACLN